MAATPVPDWLAKRGGTLSPGVRVETHFVLIGGAPQYKLEARPAAGKYVCIVQETVNGRQVGDATPYPTAAAALAGGLDQLRAALGW